MIKTLYLIAMAAASLIGCSLTLDQGLDVPAFILAGLAIILGISALISCAESE